MKKNMGAADRVIRVLLAVTLVIMYVKGIISGTTAILLLIVAAVFLLTSLAAFCPLYVLLGFNTCKRKKMKSRTLG